MVGGLSLDGGAIKLEREQMEVAGLDPDSLELREIHTDAEAAAEGFPGSPTIRIDGRDIQDPARSPSG